FSRWRLLLSNSAATSCWFCTSNSTLTPAGTATSVGANWWSLSTIVTWGSAANAWPATVIKANRAIGRRRGIGRPGCNCNSFSRYRHRGAGASQIPFTIACTKRMARPTLRQPSSLQQDVGDLAVGRGVEEVALAGRLLDVEKHLHDEHHVDR